MGNPDVEGTAAVAAAPEARQPNGDEPPGNLLRPRRIAAIVTLSCALLVTLAFPLAAPTLNGVAVGGLPLGYYFAAQGTLIVVALLGLWLSGPWNHSSLAQRFGALAAAISATGSWLTAGLVFTLVGGLFVYGFDGLPLYLGLAAGLLLSLVFIAPALDRTGARHVDELIGRLTGDRTAAFAVALGMAAGLALLISIEVEIFSLAAGIALGPELSDGLPQLPWSLAMAGAAFALVLSLIPGRDFWAVLLALSLVALVIALGLVMTALVAASPVAVPAVPQLAYGPALESLTASERQLLVEGLADPVVMPPFLRPFVIVSALNFALLTMSMALGAAVLPHTLWRRRKAAEIAAAPYEGEADDPTGRHHAFLSRHKAAFGLVLAAAVLTALPAASILVKHEVYRSVAEGLRMETLPDWAKHAESARFMRICGAQDAEPAAPGDPASVSCGDADGRLRISDIAINPAGVLLMVPDMAGLAPMAGQGFAGLVALLALVAATATLRMSTQALLGPFARTRRDLVSPALEKPPANGGLPHFLVALVVAAAAAALFAGLGESPVNRLHWAFALFASSVFPIVFLAAVAPRIDGRAMALGALTGGGLALYYMIGTSGPFAAEFALLWAPVSDAPPWLLEELESLIAQCRAGGADVAEACRAAVVQGRELANWFGIDPRAAGVLAAPVAVVVTGIATLFVPSFWRRR